MPLVLVEPRYHKFFFANQCKVIKELQKEYAGVYVSFPRNNESNVVRVVGPPDRVEAVSRKIRDLIIGLEDNVMVTCVIHPKYHGAIIGNKGRKIKELENKFDVKVIFPDKNVCGESGLRDSNINIFGMSGNCELAVLNLKESLQEIGVPDAMSFVTKKRTGYVPLPKPDPVEEKITITCEIPHKFRGRIIGTKGANIKEKELRYNVKIKFSEKNSNIVDFGGDMWDEVTITGPAEMCVLARDALMESEKLLEKGLPIGPGSIQKKDVVTDEKVTKTCNIPFWVHGAIIGSKGCNLKEIERKFKVKVKFPRKNEDHANEEMCNRVTVKGTPEMCELAINALLESWDSIRKGGVSSNPRNPIENDENVTIICKIHPRLHGAIIGPKGFNLKQMERQYRVKIQFPQRCSEEGNSQGGMNDKVTITGPAELCHLAMEALMESGDSIEKGSTDVGVKSDFNDLFECLASGKGDSEKPLVSGPVPPPRPSRHSMSIGQPAPQVIKNNGGCRFCGYFHPRGKCFAYGKRCSLCKKLNHLARVCTSNPNRMGAPEDSDMSQESWMEMITSNFNKLFEQLSSHLTGSATLDGGKESDEDGGDEEGEATSLNPTINLCHQTGVKNQERRGCRNCGSFHPYGKCPAFGHKCTLCHKMNHFACVCSLNRLKEAQELARNNRKISVGSSQESEEPLNKSTGAIPKKITRTGRVTKRSARESKCFLKSCTLKHDEVVELKTCKHLFFRNCISKEILDGDRGNFVCPALKPCKTIISEAEISDILTPVEYEYYASGERIFQCLSPNCSSSCTFWKKPDFFHCPACGRLNCLSCKKIHRTGGLCQDQPDTDDIPDENIQEKKNEIYDNLLNLEMANLVLNSEPFTCSICFEDYLPSEGVILKECLHVFCLECLQNLIKSSDDSEVACPFRGDNYACDCFILESEIQALLSPEDYEQRLTKTLILAEMKMSNSFHCKTPNCEGWCEVEDYTDADEFLCPICLKFNCLQCAVIHNNMTCQEYQNSLFEEMNDHKIKEMVRTEEAMHCPNCKALIVKNEGCDGIVCILCRLEICWATKMPRWGPKGKGDTSGGCRCGVNGIKCHPSCKFCH